MIADGLWQDRRHRLPSPHQPRRRRDCLGELVQIDSSEHGWFEDRGPPCTLLAFVDDATSRLMQLRFVTSESAFDYFRTTRAYLEEHGKPVAFYSDKHGIFRVNSKEAAVEGAGTTPRCCRGSDLIDRASLVFRYVTNCPLPSRPPSRRGLG